MPSRFHWRFWLVLMVLLPLMAASTSRAGYISPVISRGISLLDPPEDETGDEQNASEPASRENQDESAKDKSQPKQKEQSEDSHSKKDNDAVEKDDSEKQSQEDSEKQKADKKSSKDASAKSPSKRQRAKDKRQARKDASTSATASKPAESADKKPEPQVEVFIPSVHGLADAFRKSKTFELSRGLLALLPSTEKTTDEDFDWGEVLKLLQQIASWPDTSFVFACHSQDSEGRPRWTLQLDWPVNDLRDRVDQLLKSETAAKLLKDIRLVAGDAGIWRLEMPDMLLAVIKATGDGHSLILSDKDMEVPERIYGQKKGSKSKDLSSELPDAKPGQLIYCRLNLAANENESQDSLFSSFAGVRDILFSASLLNNGLWRESFVIGWNPLLGMAIKSAIAKVDEGFKCPKDAYVTAVFNIALAQGMADAISGLPPMTMGWRTGADIGLVVAPGTGFFPYPDLYYQFHLRRKEATIEDIRKFIKEDKKTRAEDDKEPAWFETRIDDSVVFYNDPGVDGGGGLMPVTYRTVIFFDGDKDDDNGQRVIVAQTSTMAADAVEHWKNLSKDTRPLPSSKKIHWQARVGWEKLYALVQPYITLASGYAEDSAAAPSAASLKAALQDSVVDIRITLGGMAGRHTGPIPIWAGYVPLVAGTSLSSGADAGSEAAREQSAARNLRVLYEHAKLFKKDYGRWPATVAELDGYVDFASHPELLYIRAKEKSFAEGIVSMLTKSKKEVAEESEDVERPEIDDSLYEIAWAKDDGWRLKYRPDEFVRFETIYVDGTGEIHRVEKKDSKKSASKADTKKEKKSA